MTPRQNLTRSREAIVLARDRATDLQVRQLLHHARMHTEQAQQQLLDLQKYAARLEGFMAASNDPVTQAALKKETREAG